MKFKCKGRNDLLIYLRINQVTNYSKLLKYRAFIGFHPKILKNIEWENFLNMEI